MADPESSRRTTRLVILGFGVLALAIGRFVPFRYQTNFPEVMPRDVMPRLALNFRMDRSLRPGDSFPFEVLMADPRGGSRPVTRGVTWSVRPAVGASIDPRSGLLRLASSVAPGASFRVSAAVSGGSSLSTTVRVVAPAGATRAPGVTRAPRATPAPDTGPSGAAAREDNPLVGSWRQSGWKLCTPVPTLPAGSIDPPLQELLFNADGTFSVTWMPFEGYKDYWGHYGYSIARKAFHLAPDVVDPGARDDPTAGPSFAGPIELVIERGNFVPPDFSGKGSFIVEGKQLRLIEVRLGTRQAPHPAALCELSFVRQN